MKSSPGAPAPSTQAAWLRAVEHHQNGRLDEAEVLYRQILQAMPAHADALHLLGVIALQRGQLEAAADLIQRAIWIQPAPNYFCNLGRAFLRLGRLDLAIPCQVEALKRGDDMAIRLEFVQTIRMAHFQAPHPEVREWVLRALEELWADPAELLTPATSLIEAQPATQEGMARSRLAWQPGLLDPALLAGLAADRLLLSLLERDVLTSIALERLLTLVRRQMLDAALADAASNDALAPFHAALARQCYINEYVYACSDAEQEQLTRLHARLAACLADGAKPDPRWLVARAAYAPLHDLPGAAAWASLEWPPALAALFTQQVSEPAIEQTLRSRIPCLTATQDSVSRQVQAQYEAHPYPRWIQAPPGGVPCDIDTLLRHQCPGAPFRPLGLARPLDVLVAGCGTGQHPIQVARQFPGARVLALDLSLSSLSYARRKTEELGLHQIEYAQGDILELGALDRRFDLIESAGVLHHLADPMAGWQVLCGLLRPGGLMFLGLYSELGRRDVVAARQRLAGQALPATATDIRNCRQALMSDELAPQFEQFLTSRDFYATSACRDLLFHVQEHRYTLPRLKDMLAQLGLQFIGFTLDPATTAAYTQQFPDDPARTRLDHWHDFETARLETFSRMYQFWVQKPA